MRSAFPGMFGSRLETFSIKLGSRWTTIRLEREMMDALHEIARSHGISLNELCTEIALDRSEGSLISALRVFIVNYFRGLVLCNGDLGDGRRLVVPGPQPRGARDWVRRRQIPLAAKNAASELVALYQWWENKRAVDKQIPTHDDIDPRIIGGLGLGGLVHVVDASADDPMNFRFRLWARRVLLNGAQNLAGQRLAEVPGREYREAAAEDYSAARTTGTPRLQKIDASVSNSRRAYQRLIVPFRGTDGRPDRLLIAVHYEAPDLVS
jgi:predicted DNA-binding ribbon-helix-helix protein